MKPHHPVLAVNLSWYQAEPQVTNATKTLSCLPAGPLCWLVVISCKSQRWCLTWLVQELPMTGRCIWSIAHQLNPTPLLGTEPTCIAKNKPSIQRSTLTHKSVGQASSMYTDYTTVMLACMTNTREDLQDFWHSEFWRVDIMRVWLVSSWQCPSVHLGIYIIILKLCVCVSVCMPALRVC